MTSVSSATDAFTVIGDKRIKGIESTLGSPFNGKPVGTIHNSTLGDVEAAIESSILAGKSWSQTPAHARSALLMKVAHLMQQRSNELATIMALQTGKTLKDAKMETARSISAMIISAEEAKRICGQIIPMDAVEPGTGKMGFTLRVPVGVVAGITPFNAPLSTLIHKLGPALAGGNTLVVKPHPNGSGVTAMMAEIVLEAGVPPGVFNVIHGDAAVGSALVQSPKVALVNFTGSGAVADQIIRSIGLKRVLLELGGNAPTIVHSDANLNKAIPTCIEAAFGLTGQSCISTQRIYVHRSLYDEFLQRFVEGVKKRKVGDPTDPSTEVGPMINEASAKRVEEWVKEAVSQGARLECGGVRTGNVVTPAVLTQVSSKMKVVCEEVFGPVASITPYDTVEEVINWANDTPWGLKSGVFTQSLDIAFRFARELEYGAININAASRARTDQEPSGGIKQSGWGKEGPRYAIEEMTDVKMVSFTSST